MRCYKKALALDPGVAVAGSQAEQLLDSLRTELGAAGLSSPKTPTSLVSSPRLEDSAHAEVEPSKGLSWGGAQAPHPQPHPACV